MSSGDSGWGMNTYSMNRHGKGINIVFLDNSVNNINVKDLWTLKWNNEFNTNGIYTSGGGMTSSEWPDWVK